MRRRARFLALGAACVLVGATPLSAQAGTSDGPVRDKGHDSFDETICGITAHFEVDFSSVSMNRPVKGSDGQAFYSHSTFRYAEEISTSGGTVFTQGRGFFHDQKARHIAGDVWEFVWLEGNRVTVRDASGDLLVRADGARKLRAQFDTLGDSQPGGELVPGTFEVLSERGDGSTDDEFCAAALPELT